MATEFDTSRSQYEQYRFCYDNGHADFVQKAALCFRFWNSDQWDPSTRAKLEREGRPALTLNVIESLVRSMKGIQRALRNDVRYIPVQSANAESARVRDAIWLHTQNQNQFDFMESDVYEKGLIMSRAYYDVRVAFEESMQGEIKIRSRRSQDVVLDPSVDEYDPDDWPQVFTRRYVSYLDIQRMYGKEKADAVGYAEFPEWYDYEDSFMQQQMGLLPYYRHATIADMDLKRNRAHLLLERQYFNFKRKDVFVDLLTGDWSEIPENWERNRIAAVLEQVPDLSTMPMDVKTVRWTTTVADKVMHDEDSPYKRFTIVPYFPTFVDGVTRGAVESLIDPQQLYNKMTSAELHIINTTANSGYKVKTGSLKNMTLEELEQAGSKTGFVAELEDVGDMEKFTPNQTPQGHDRLSFKADQIMRQLSGVSDSSRGFARDDASGGKVLQDQAGQEVNFAGWLGNLHRSKQLLARAVNDCAQTYYTETRVLQINRGSALLPQMETVTLNQPTPEGLVLNDVTAGKYTTVLVPAPTRSTMSEEDFNLLLKLRTEVGVAIPDTMLIELSPASNKSQIIQMLSGTPDSNERQRQAEQLAVEQQALEAQKAAATAKKDEAASVLNQARAEKFAVEAASDPDASYERVEMARIQTDAELATATLEQRRQSEAARLELDRQIAEDNRRDKARQAAVQVAKLEVDTENRAADRDAAKEESRLPRRGDKKPATTKKSK